MRDISEMEAKWYFRLSQLELSTFKDVMRLKSVQQMESTQSLLLKGDEFCYKFPVRQQDAVGMHLVSVLLEKAAKTFAIERHTSIAFVTSTCQWGVWILSKFDPV